MYKPTFHTGLSKIHCNRNMKISNPTVSKGCLQNFPANDAKLLLVWLVHVLLIVHIPWLETQLPVLGIELVLLPTTQPQNGHFVLVR